MPKPAQLRAVRLRFRARLQQLCPAALQLRAADHIRLHQLLRALFRRFSEASLRGGLDQGELRVREIGAVQHGQNGAGLHVLPFKDEQLQNASLKPESRRAQCAAHPSPRARPPAACRSHPSFPACRTSGFPASAGVIATSFGFVGCCGCAGLLASPCSPAVVSIAATQDQQQCVRHARGDGSEDWQRK